MRYHIELQILSFSVLLIFAVVFFSRSRLKNIQNQIYGVMLLQALLLNFMDMGRIIAVCNRELAGSMMKVFV